MTQIVEYLEDNIKKDISLLDLSNKLGYSYNYLSSFFKKFFQIGFSELVNEYRINNACQLLSETSKTIQEISIETGYSSTRTFNRTFLEIVGKTPSTFRNEKQISNNTLSFN
jgi:AraC-like DNA-binding protein